MSSKSAGGLEGGSVFGAEGLGHVGAVQPHLVGIDLLVPVTAAGGAWLQVELVVQELRSLGILCLRGGAVEEEHGAAHLDVVEGVGVGLVASNRPIGVDASVYCGLDRVVVRRVVGVVPLGHHAVQADAVLVSPGAGGGGGCGLRLLEDGCGHLLRGGGRRDDLRQRAGDEAEEECCGQQLGQAHASFSVNSKAANQNTACGP